MAGPLAPFDATAIGNPFLDDGVKIPWLSGNGELPEVASRPAAAKNKKILLYSHLAREDQAADLPVRTWWEEAPPQLRRKIYDKAGEIPIPSEGRPPGPSGLRANGPIVSALPLLLLFSHRIFPADCNRLRQKSEALMTIIGVDD
jgi:hypothetical protein